MKSKPGEKAESRRLREEEGVSVKEIARRLQVSKSSVSLWVRDVILSAAQREELSVHRAFAAANERRMLDARQKRLEYQQRGRLKANRNDIRYMAGCMLYWAEGSKKRNDVVFVNSDPEMVRFFIDFLRDYYGVENKEIALTLQVHKTSAISFEQTRDFWLDHLKLDLTCLRKCVIKEGQPDGKLKYGIARVVVHRTDIVQEIYGAVQEFVEFDRPAWLD